MRKPTVRYFLFATGVLAVCIAVHQIPFPPATVVYANDADPKIPPFRWHYVLSWWPVQALTLVVGVATLMHVLTSLAGLYGWRQWLAAILVPTLSFTAWHWFSVNFLGYHPGSTDEWGCIQGGLVGFTIGFAIVSWVVALPELLANARTGETEENTQP
ncbi:hypothetical protein [Allorhodopirellula solitaria]|uniref:Uncharacterized protein n=1 Tax=Allorhodopirellula solitaria TaxID=2527987 RepID=A0A5C5XVL9_9BACT|nr:hypothetical protein [Allorhodopirellula solitaria]TWT67376.1 hypothetical protein CA85_22260 [Allorhodopirellula solitaria]